MRKPYPTDLTDAEWAILAPLIPGPKPGGRPREHDMREILNAIFYLLRAGCPWRMLPHEFSPWSTVHWYFRTWRRSGLWEEINAALRDQVRLRSGRSSTPTAAIVDSQSARTTEKGGREDMTELSA